MSSVAFVIPKIVDNLDGWGPSTIPEQFKELPYKPFNKGDKISKAADWTQTTNTGKQYQEDEDDFILVDNQPKQKLKKKKNLTQFQKRMHRIQAQQQQRRIQQQNLLQNPPAKQNKAKKMQQRPRNYSKNYDNKRTTESSIEIQPEWEQVTQIDLANLGKLVSTEYEVEDVEQRGELFYLDSAYIQGISTKTEKLLEKTDKSNPRITTSDDPVIRDLVMKGEGDIFATDSILNLLGASPHIPNAWDIIVHRVGSKLILDKREKSQIDMITVNAPQDMFHDTSDQVNSPLGLSQEATYINQHFPIQVLKKDGETVKFDKPNPFKSPDHSPVAYRYRKWSLDNGFELVARCEIDAAKKTANNIQYITVRALNQYDPKTIVDWRQKLDTQEAAILASELKNNHSKLVKWAVQAILSGTDQVVIGYVVRTSPKDKNHHTVLAVKTYNTLEFANLIGVKAENVFGILDALTNSFMRLPEGKYLLAKDPNSKNIASLYKLPPGALEEESADEDNDETEEIEGEDKE